MLCYLWKLRLPSFDKARARTWKWRQGHVTQEKPLQQIHHDRDRPLCFNEIAAVVRKRDTCTTRVLHDGISALLTRKRARQANLKYWKIMDSRTILTAGSGVYYETAVWWVRVGPPELGTAPRGCMGVTRCRNDCWSETDGLLSRNGIRRGRIS